MSESHPPIQNILVDDCLPVQYYVTSQGGELLFRYSYADVEGMFLVKTPVSQPALPSRIKDWILVDYVEKRLS